MASENDLAPLVYRMQTSCGLGTLSHISPRTRTSKSRATTSMETRLTSPIFRTEGLCMFGPMNGLLRSTSIGTRHAWSILLSTTRMSSTTSNIRSNSLATSWSWSFSRRPISEDSAKYHRIFLKCAPCTQIAAQDWREKSSTSNLLLRIGPSIRNRRLHWRRNRESSGKPPKSAYIHGNCMSPRLWGERRVGRTVDRVASHVEIVVGPQENMPEQNPTILCHKYYVWFVVAIFVLCCWCNTSCNSDRRKILKKRVVPQGCE